MAKSTANGAALANYVMKDEKGYELYRNGLSGETPKEIMEEMKVFQNLNQNAKNKTLSLVLSPDKTEGQNLSKKELREITKDFLKKMGIDPEKDQLLCYTHLNKSHIHVHVVVNRVRPDGKLINDHFIGKKAQWSAHHVALERGMISPKQVMFDKIKTIEMEKDLNRAVKNEIIKKHDFVMKQNPKSMEVYINKMKELGVKVAPTINKQGQIQGHRMIDLATGKDFKASEVHRNLGLKNIMEKGVPFQKSNLEFTKPIAVAQKLALNIATTLVKQIIKQTVSHGMGY